MKARPLAPVPRVALTFDEAAAALGVSLSHFRRRVAPDLRVVRSALCPVPPETVASDLANRGTLAGRLSFHGRR